MRNLIVIAIIALGLTACNEPPTYRLVALIGDEEYVVDTGLTLRECRVSPLAEEYVTVCELEG